MEDQDRPQKYEVTLNPSILRQAHVANAWADLARLASKSLKRARPKETDHE